MVVFLAVAHLVIPPFFLVCVSMFNCVFFFPSTSSTLPLSRSMPGSEVITTEPLHRSLMWCATQMRAHTCTRAHTHADTPRSSQDKQPSHSGPCASVCSLKALTAKKEKTRPRLWCAPMFATCTLAGFDNTPLDLGKGHIFVLRSCNVWAWRIDVLCVHKDKKTIVYIEMRNAQMDVVAGMWWKPRVWILSL